MISVSNREAGKVRSTPLKNTGNHPVGTRFGPLPETKQTAENQAKMSGMWSNKKGAGCQVFDAIKNCWEAFQANRANRTQRL